MSVHLKTLCHSLKLLCIYYMLMMPFFAPYRNQKLYKFHNTKISISFNKIECKKANKNTHTHTKTRVTRTTQHSQTDILWSLNFICRIVRIKCVDNSELYTRQSEKKAVPSLIETHTHTSKANRQSTNYHLNIVTRLLGDNGYIPWHWTNYTNHVQIIRTQKLYYI